MEPEEFEELVARAGGTFQKKTTGYAVDLKPREQLWPRDHEWVPFGSVGVIEDCIGNLRSALLVGERELRELLAAIRREDLGRIIAAHALV